ncbi:MAG: hypothetical protein IJY50_08160 [Clostridia bacterium]|nr:hypothetical protein [Clostridia bacterium]
MKNLRQRQWVQGVLVCMAALMLLSGGIALSLFPAAPLSKRENRYLTQWPPFTINGWKDGSYTAALDTYATERFPIRNELRQVRALLCLGQGQMEVGGVLLCTDGSLCRRMNVNQRIYTQNLTALQRLSAQYPQVTVAVAPRRIDMRTAVLPALYDTGENIAVWEQLRSALPDSISFPDLTEDEHWYRTDHHWSTMGAYLAYCQLGASLGYTPFEKESFQAVAVSDTFLGTSDAAAGIPFVTPDTVILFRYAEDRHFTVKREKKAVPFEGFYDMEQLTERDQYAVFLGGNCGTLEITGKGDRPRLVVIKDSFANALLPFLARHFDILAIDPRYCAEFPSALMQEGDRLLALCGMQTLCESFFLKL